MIGFGKTDDYVYNYYAEVGKLWLGAMGSLGQDVVESNLQHLCALKIRADAICGIVNCEKTVFNIFGLRLLRER